MNRPARKFQWTIVAGVLLVLATLGIVITLVQINWSIASRPALPKLAEVPEFTLTDQHGRTVSRADLLGHVWVADIIFTRCPGPCATMTRNMRELQDTLPSRSQARLVTLTTDPEFDTPAVMKIYAERFGADHSRWLFLTGSKREIANLAVDGLKLTSIEKEPDQREIPEDLFIHSTIFVVVDKRGHLRGVFETTGPDVNAPRALHDIVSAVKRLEREP
jgi:protein SCO1